MYAIPDGWELCSGPGRTSGESLTFVPFLERGAREIAPWRDGWTADFCLRAGRLRHHTTAHVSHAACLMPHAPVFIADRLSIVPGSPVVEGQLVRSAGSDRVFWRDDRWWEEAKCATSCPQRAACTPSRPQRPGGGSLEPSLARSGEHVPTPAEARSTGTPWDRLRQGNNPRPTHLLEY